MPVKLFENGQRWYPGNALNMLGTRLGRRRRWEYHPIFIRTLSILVILIMLFAEKSVLMDELEEIALQIRSCRLCPLWANRRNAVPGEGNPRAEIMIVGEGPGEDEDLQGRPFVGRSGRLLTEALENAGIKREEVFITNVVKCRPPQNREPTPEERAICSAKYLYKQMDVVKPRLVLLLGAVAVQTVLGKGSVTAVRGKAFEKNGRVFFCTFHPAAVLYNPANKTVFFQDIAKAKELATDLRAFTKQQTLD